ncbi:MAG: rod shape-determining protein MreD [Candidatus Berkiellales bacterium]
MLQQLKWWLFFTVGFYFCAVLTLLPLPLDFQWYRPQWLLLLMIFCQLQQPPLFNPMYAWVAGLLFDSLMGTPLGQYALVFAVVSYITALMRRKFLLKPLQLQMGKIFLLIALGQILMLWFHALVGENPHSLLYWMGSVTSCLVWPLFVTVFQGWERLLRINASSLRGI